LTATVSGAIFEKFEIRLPQMSSVLNIQTDTEPPSDAMRIERASLHDVVVSRIRDMIIEGLIEVGARIHEGDLCRQLGVSRTPLREALKVLAPRAWSISSPAAARSCTG
jgi:hypothetical protein